jgi:hypothetical protein
MFYYNLGFGAIYLEKFINLNLYYSDRLLFTITVSL